MMEVFNEISREELEALFEDWLRGLDIWIQQNGEHVESGEFNKHILIISALSCLARPNLSVAPCNSGTAWR
jgi:hypothetical protein